MIDPEIWDEVPYSQVPPTEVRPYVIEKTGHESQTQVTVDDQFLVFLIDQRCRGLEVVHAAKESTLLANSTTIFSTSIIISAGDIRCDVQDPTQQLLADEGDSSNDWSLFAELRDLVSELPKL